MSRSFTDQQPRVATEADCAARWGGAANGARFRCYLCGHRFKPGDTWRWVWATHRSAINFLVCAACDGPDALERWLTHVRVGEKEFWWMGGIEC